MIERRLAVSICVVVACAPNCAATPLSRNDVLNNAESYLTGTSATLDGSNLAAPVTYQGISCDNRYELFKKLIGTSFQRTHLYPRKRGSYEPRPRFGARPRTLRALTCSYPTLPTRV